MVYQLILLLAVSLLNPVSSQNDTQCVENPTGEVSLNVAVRGIPGPDGPQGPKGMIGPRGNIGVKGDRGEQGEKGERGDTGSIGPKGMNGALGSNGQKGIRGLQGIPGPVGTPGLEGPVGPRGHPGPDGARGPQGRAGLPGPRGPQGEPGDTVLTKQEFTRVTSNVHTSVLSKVNTTLILAIDSIYQQLDILNDTVMQEIQSGNEAVLTTVINKLLVDSLDSVLVVLKQVYTKCGIFGPWRRIVHFDSNHGDVCPPGLRTVANAATNQRACGRTQNKGGCESVYIPVQSNYTKVCGIVKGYQENTPDAFRHSSSFSVDDNYVDGVSITQGSPRRHLWTYATGLSEQSRYHIYRCPCARPNPSDRAGVPSFIGEHFYCESGFPVDYQSGVTVWDDPLWDGANCQAPGNKCCERYGWFYRDVPPSSDDIELRTCTDQGYKNEDTLISGYEFWVI